MLNTSRESYHKLNRHKTESERQKILTFLQKWRELHFSLSEIAAATAIPVNVVWSRTNDLVKRGDVVFDGIHYSKETKRDCQMWRIKQ